MSVSRLAAVAGVLGGLAWVAGGLVGDGSTAYDALYLAGLGLLVVAFAGMGYALVATAPVWLRAVVTVATPLLGGMCWLILQDALPSEVTALLVGGVLLVAGSLVGFLRARPAQAEAAPLPARGRRAAR